MSAVDALVRVLLTILDVLGPEIGPALVRKKVDEWELARVPSEVAFRTKFPGEGPL